MTEQTQAVVPLSLDQVVLGENIRCELKPYKIENLAKKILAMGGIHTALKVEPHDNGTYLLREGYYRYAAALWLEEHGHTITLPCIIEPVTLSRRERIFKQLSENRDRENLSPLEIARTIQLLVAEDTPREEIMDRFSRPGRGKTPTGMEPMSEAAYSYYLRYTELPAEAQQMLHHGTLAVGAANRILDERDPEKRAQLLLDAEDKRRQRVAREGKQLANEVAKQQAVLARHHETAETVKELEQQYARKKTASEAAYKAIGNLKGKARQAPLKAYRVVAAEAGELKIKLKTAQVEKKKAAKEIKRAAATHRQVEQQTHKKRTALSERDVKAALADQGRAKLGAIDMRAAVKQWSQGPYPKVQAIAAIIAKTFDSILTAGQSLRELARVTGEEKGRRK